MISIIDIVDIINIIDIIYVTNDYPQCGWLVDISASVAQHISKYNRCTRRVNLISIVIIIIFESANQDISKYNILLLFSPSTIGLQSKTTLDIVFGKLKFPKYLIKIFLDK